MFNAFITFTECSYSICEVKIMKFITDSFTFLHASRQIFILYSVLVYDFLNQVRTEIKTKTNYNLQA